MEGMTLTEMAKKLGIPQRTIERRIQRAGIKPLTKEAVYPADTLEKIKDIKMGRPRKAAVPETAKKTNKSAK
jgi:IS30 family transposase